LEKKEAYRDSDGRNKDRTGIEFYNAFELLVSSTAENIYTNESDANTDNNGMDSEIEVGVIKNIIRFAKTTASMAVELNNASRNITLTSNLVGNATLLMPTYTPQQLVNSFNTFYRTGKIILPSNASKEKIDISASTTSGTDVGTGNAQDNAGKGTTTTHRPPDEKYMEGIEKELQSLSHKGNAIYFQQMHVGGSDSGTGILESKINLINKEILKYKTNIQEITSEQLKDEFQNRIYYLESKLKVLRAKDEPVVKGKPIGGKTDKTYFDDIVDPIVRRRGIGLNETN
jgi:hypothetical protein